MAGLRHAPGTESDGCRSTSPHRHNHPFNAHPHTPTPSRRGQSARSGRSGRCRRTSRLGALAASQSRGHTRSRALTTTPRSAAAWHARKSNRRNPPRFPHLPPYGCHRRRWRRRGPNSRRHSAVCDGTAASLAPQPSPLASKRRPDARGPSMPAPHPPLPPAAPSPHLPAAP